MKRTIWTGTLTVVVGLAGAGLLAQTSAGSQPTTPPQTSAGSASDRKVTITGCLKTAPESTTAEATGTTGTTGTAGATGAAGTTGSAAAADAKYILTDAVMKPVDVSGASTVPDTSAPSSPPTTTSGAHGPTYRLIANPSALTPHVGKKLELTGTLEDENASSAPNGAAAASSDATGPALRVESGRIIANSCSQ